MGLSLGRMRSTFNDQCEWVNARRIRVGVNGPLSSNVIWIQLQRMERRRIILPLKNASSPSIFPCIACPIGEAIEIT